MCVRVCVCVSTGESPQLFFKSCHYHVGWGCRAVTGGCAPLKFRASAIPSAREQFQTLIPTLMTPGSGKWRACLDKMNMQHHTMKERHA